MSALPTALGSQWSLPGRRVIPPGSATPLLCSLADSAVCFVQLWLCFKIGFCAILVTQFLFP